MALVKAVIARGGRGAGRPLCDARRHRPGRRLGPLRPRPASPRRLPLRLVLADLLHRHPVRLGDAGLGRPMRGAASRGAACIGTAAVAATPDRPVRIGTVGAGSRRLPQPGRGHRPRPARRQLPDRPRRPRPRRARHRPARPRPHRQRLRGAGQWLGIVFGPAGRPDEYCGVGSAIPRPRAYDGPCHSGWVAARYIRIVAG